MANKNENKKYHYLYKTTNLINGKYYYGMHSTNDLDDGYIGSGSYLRNAIHKHGKKNFKREILEYFDSREELVQGEIDLITDELLNEDLCMNLKPGGDGGWTLEHTKKSNKKQKELRETDPEWVKKYSENQSKALKNAYNNGTRIGTHFYDWTDKTHTDETKKKMSESSKSMCKGEKNGSFGTCWITKDGKNKKIKKEELETFINQGWNKGRKLK